MELFMYLQIPKSTALEGYTNYEVLQPGIREHGESLENTERMENMEKMENINQMTFKTLFMIKKALFVAKNILLENQMTQNALFYGIYRDSHNMIMGQVSSTLT